MALTAENRHTGGKKGFVKASKLLRDCRYVSKTVTSDLKKPDTPQQATLRSEKEKAPSKFTDRLMKLEEAHQDRRRGNVPVVTGGTEGGGANDSPAPPQGEDSGEERLRELIVGLLREARG